MTSWQLLQQRIRPYRWHLLAGLALSLLNSSLAVPVAGLLRWAFDHSMPDRNLNQLALIGGALLALRTLSTLSVIVGQRLHLGVTRDFVARLRQDILGRIFAFPHIQLKGGPQGRVPEVLITATERVELLVGALLNQCIPYSILALTLAGVLAYLNLTLLGLMLLVWPITWILNEVFRRRAVNAARHYNRTFAHCSTRLRWQVASLEFIHIHDSVQRELDTAGQKIQQTREASKKLAILNTTYVQVQTLLLTGVSLVVLVVGGYQVSEATMTLGSLISFFTVTSLLNNALRDVAAGLYWVVVGNESLQEVADFLTDPASPPYVGTRPLEATQSLEFCDVSFAYPGSPQPLLQGLNLELKPGQLLALAGPNGCGKSTMLALLLGFLRPNQGCLKADGVPYDEVDLGYLRSRLGVVAQEPLLFQGSLGENVAYSRPEASAEEIWRALDLACAREWVESLPQGLETPIGDRGGLISGGQRQRLAIARALLGEPGFLILDEPTNHLDARAIAQITRNLQQLPRRPGILIITHDEGVAGQADAILRLGEGLLRLDKAPVA